MNERFDIDAVAEEDVAITGEKARERNRLRLRSLLEQRFQLKLHRETRIISSYVLVLGRKGPRLKQANSDEGSSLRLNPSRDHLEGRGQAMDALADFLWTELERPVFNQTGLREEYDFDLDFQPERHDPSSGAKPSLMAAIQEQLGLKLQARKMPVELLVVDGVERPKGN
jgi:uncharacterized protein (TIGR03435 family)